jgi:hypothetical protein
MKRLRSYNVSILFGALGNIGVLASILSNIAEVNVLYNFFIIFGPGLCVLAVLMAIAEIFYKRNRKQIFFGLLLGLFPFAIVFGFALFQVARGVTV